jgi:uncharacterized protein (TIRG00374 family)
MKNNYSIKSSKIWGRLSKLTYTISILAFGVFYLHNNKEKLSLIDSINSEYLILLLVCGIIAYFPISLEFKYEMLLFKIKLKFKEWFGLSLINTMYNYFIPAGGGLFARAYYLKKKYNFDYSKYIALTGGASLLGFGVASFSALTLIILKYFLSGFFNADLLGISLLLFLGSLLLTLIFILSPNLRLARGWKIFDTLIIGVQRSNNYFNSNYKILSYTIFSRFALIFFMGLRLFFSFKVLDIEVDLISILTIQSLIIFSMVISITPGNIGVKEGIIGLLATMIGIPLKDAILAAAIDRAVAMIIVFALGGIYHFILLREIKQSSY